MRIDHYIFIWDDIEVAGPKKNQTEYIGADADFNIWDLRIHTLKSNPMKVWHFFRVQEVKTFFHAEYLNWWYVGKRG